MERIAWKRIHYHMEIDSQQEFALWLRELKQGRCINLDGCHGREVQKGGDMCIPMADSFGEGNGTPLQYSCLENPMDGGAW